MSYFHLERIAMRCVARLGVGPISPVKPMSNLPAARSVLDIDDATRLFCEQPGEGLPELYLADELLRSEGDAALAARSSADTAALMHVARWARDFLVKPHPALGRSGHVCPFVDASIRERQFLLAVLHSAATEQRQAEDAMLGLGRYFLQLEPTAGRLAQRRAIVVLFPDVPEQRSADIINGMHQRLKPYFLRRGLMLGEFYKDSAKPGLHNPEFRPLRSDVPLLVIRSMLLTDIAFLNDRASFVRAFIENFKAQGCAEIRSYVDRRRGTMSDAQTSMLLQQVAEYDPGVRRAEQSRRIDHTSPLAAARSAAQFGAPRPPTDS